MIEYFYISLVHYFFKIQNYSASILVFQTEVTLEWRVNFVKETPTRAREQVSLPSGNHWVNFFFFQNSRLFCSHSNFSNGSGSGVKSKFHKKTPTRAREQISLPSGNEQTWALILREFYLRIHFKNSQNLFIFVGLIVIHLVFNKFAKFPTFRILIFLIKNI